MRCHYIFKRFWQKTFSIDQQGFRSERLIVSAASANKQLKDNQHFINIFCDLNRAFVCVYDNLLIKKNIWYDRNNS